jgi:hypothetical protein
LEYIPRRAINYLKGDPDNLTMVVVVWSACGRRCLSSWWL